MPEPLTPEQLTALVESNARAIQALSNETREGFEEVRRDLAQVAQLLAIGYGAQVAVNKDFELRLRELQRWQRQQEGNPEN